MDIYLLTNGVQRFEQLQPLTTVPNNGTAHFTLPDNTQGTTNARIVVAGHDNYFFDISDESFTIKPKKPEPNLPCATATAPANSPVAANFSQPINPATVGNIRVFSSQSGGRKAGTASVIGGSRLSFQPTTPFKPGETVSYTIPASVQTTSGVPVAQSTFQFTVAAAPGPGTFIGGSDVRVASQPMNVTTADVDGDGDIDLITSNTAGTISVRLNTGAGQFSGGYDLPVYPAPQAVKTADIDNDGDLDLLAAHNKMGLISILRNTGGAFDTAEYVSVGGVPQNVMPEDVDSDGDLDVLVSYGSLDGAAVLLNDGTGHFTATGIGNRAARGGTTPGNPGPLAKGKTQGGGIPGDPDCDGDIDLFLPTGDGFDLYLNNGAGTYSSPIRIPVPGAGTSVELGDLDRDGDLDLIAPAVDGSSVNIRLNRGNNVFVAPAAAAPTFTDASMATVADVDGDGDLDLIGTGFRSAVSVRLNDGDGNFSGGSEIAVGPGLPPAFGEAGNSVAMADLDGDGDLDMLVSNGTNTGGGYVSIRLNQSLVVTRLSPGSGATGSSVVIKGVNLTGATSVTFNGVSAASFTVDSATQITAVVPPTATTGLVAVVTPNGTASSPLPFTVTFPITGFSPARNAKSAARSTAVAVTFAQPITTASASEIKVFSAQTGGRKAAAVSVNGNTVTLTPTTAFKPGETVSVSVPWAVKNAAGVSAGRQIAQFTADVNSTAPASPGKFGGGADYAMSSLNYDPVVADVNGDGRLDLVAPGANSVAVRLNTVGGTFGPASSINLSFSPTSLAAADIDSDGDLDIICASSSAGAKALINGGTGSFPTSRDLAMPGNYLKSILTADLDANGALDLLLMYGSTVGIRLNTGSGVFGEENLITLPGYSPQQLLVADMDNDGRFDLLTADGAYYGKAYILYGNSEGSFGNTREWLMGQEVGRVAVADIDGDNDLDLLASNSEADRVSMRLNNGSRAFGAVTETAVGAGPKAVTTADVNGDAQLDLLTTNITDRTVSVRLNNGAGVFSGGFDVAPKVSSLNSAPLFMTTVDLDGDGDIDLVTSFYGTVSVRLNQTTNTLPTITSFTATSGSVGTVVTITGTNLTSPIGVRFNGLAATAYTAVSATQVRATVPAGASSGLISVLTASGTAISATAFTVTGGPTITSYSPGAGSRIGETVVINGTGFTGATEVRFSRNVIVPYYYLTVNSDTKITLTVPDGAVTGPITITTPTGAATSPTSLPFKVTPYIDYFDPYNGGAVGSQVTIYGTSLTEATTVEFNGTVAVFTPQSDGSLVAVVPVGATTGPISVTTPSGLYTTIDVFTVTVPNPVITSFAPTVGQVGRNVAIVGANFTSITGVTFNGRTAPGYVVNAAGTQITVNVPSGATSGYIQVSRGSTTATSSSFFTVTTAAPPAISSFTPAASGVGATVTIDGTAFTGATAVAFNGAAAVYTVVSATRITATVPTAATAGPITVTTPGGTATSTATFALLPTFTRFTPVSGPVGTSVLLSGLNLTSIRAVKFNGTDASFTLLSPTRIIATVPTGATTGVVTLEAPGNVIVSSTSNYEVGPVPMVTARRPARNESTANRSGGVSIDFSIAITAATAGNLRVFGSQSEGKKAGSVSVSGETVTLSPTRAFRAGEVVQVTVPSTMKSAIGVGARAQVFQFAAAAGAGAGQFSGGSNPSVGSQPNNIAAGDVNGDGKLDFVTANNGGTGSVSIRLGAGTGTFSGSTNLNLGYVPQDVLLADVDADGDLDLLTNNLNSNSVSIRLNANGVFSGGSNLPMTQPFAMAMGDLDGDGDLDLVVSNSFDTISVRYNNGSGGFASGYKLIAPGEIANAEHLALADIDNDGDLDLLAANYGFSGNGTTVNVWRNPGDGTFSGSTSFAVAAGVNRIATGDLDGDGDVDVVTASYQASQASVRFNDGTGAFTSGPDVSVAAGPVRVTVGDVDGDGDLDILTANSVSAGVGSISVRLNDGAGNFAASSDLPLNTSGLALADVDGDADLDLLAANYTTNTVAVRLNQFQAPTLVSFTPTSGMAGELVTITGTNFTGATAVTFNNVPAPFAVNSATSIITSVPTGATTGIIGITMPGGTATSSGAFTVLPTPPSAPTTTDASRCGSGSVTLTASGTPTGGAYRWYTVATGGTLISGATGASYTTPSLSATTVYYVSTMTSGGTESTTRTAAVALIIAVPAPPTATASRTTLPLGQSATLSITNPVAGTAYTWTGTGLNATTGTSVIATPTALGATTYQVTASVSGCASAATSLTLTTTGTSSPTIANFLPTSGWAGTVVTITGTNFTGTTAVTFNNVAATAFTVVNATTITVTVPNTTTGVIKVTAPNGAATSASAFTITPPAAPTTSGASNCGPGSLTLTASGAPTGGSYRWYTVGAGGTPIGGASGAIYTTPVLSVTTIYYVSALSSGGTEGPRSSVTAQINTLPAAPTATAQSRCSAGSVTLTAAGAPTGGTYRWYTVATGGSPIAGATGASYTTPSLSTTTTYYVSALSSVGCESTVRTSVTATINTLPNGPTTFDNSRCGAGSVALTATGAPVGAIYRWYTALTGGTPIAGATGATYATPSLTLTTTYYVTIVSSLGCESTPRVPVVAMINPRPTAPTVSGMSQCGPGALTLTAAGASVGASYRWYTALSGGAPITGATAATYVTPVLSTTTTYYVSIVASTGCESTPRTPVTATINAIPAVPVATGASRCGAGTVTLTATGAPTGATYRWYPASSGGSPISGATAATYITPSLSTTTTYYATIYTNSGCESLTRAAATATINALPAAPTTTSASRCGAGPVTLSTSGAPADGLYHWYTAATGGSPIAGANAASYTTPSLSVTTRYYVSVVSGNGCESGIRTPVTATINMVPTPPATVGASRCGAGTVTLTASGTPTGGAYRWYTSLTGGAPIAGATTATYTTPTLSGTGAFYTYYVSTVSNSGCESTSRTAVVATVNALPPTPTTVGDSRCGSGTVTLTAGGAPTDGAYRWYTVATGGTPITGAIAASYTTPSLNATTTYYVSTRSTAGCESAMRAPVVATINPLPAPPTTIGASYCGTGTVTLAAAGAPVGGTYRWYAAATGGTPLATTSTFQTPVLTATTVYYVSTVSAAGCESTVRTAITATINALPVPPSTTGASRCDDGAVTLKAAGAPTGGSYRWYMTPTGGSAIAFSTTASFTTPSLTTTTVYYVSTRSAAGCESAVRTPVTATINSLSPAATTIGASRCGPGTLLLTANGTPPGGSYNWYSVPTDGAPIIGATAATYTTPSLAASTTYYVSTRSADGCESERRTPVTATINPLPPVPNTVGASNCGPAALTLTANGAPAGGTYRWYVASTGGTPIAGAASGSFTTPNLTTTTVYYVSTVSAAGCESTTRKSVTATINAVPTAPTTISAGRCGIGAVTLIATGAPLNGSYRWYTTATGGTPISGTTGGSYPTPSLTTTTTYYVSTRSVAGCESIVRTPVTATINPIPPIPTTVGASRCGAGALVLTASGAGTGDSYRWYTVPTDGVAIIGATGAAYTTPSLNATTTYYVSIRTIAGCESPLRTAVTATINPQPAAPTTTGGSQCGPGTVTLVAAGAPLGGAYRWYSVSTGGAPINGATTASFTTPSLTGTTTYYVTTVTAAGCESTPRVPVVASIASVPPAPTVTGASHCGPGAVTLSASGAPVGGSYRWYTTSTGVTPISGASAATYPTPTLTATTTYFVSTRSTAGCESAMRIPVTATIYPVLPAPTASANPTNLLLGASTTLSVSNPVTGAIYKWTGPGLNSTTGVSVVARPTTSGIASYTVTGSVNGCVGNTATLNVSVAISVVKPIVKQVLPADGTYEGQEVLITGENLLGGTVYFNGLKAPVLSATASRLLVRVPAGATTGPLTISSGGGTNEMPPVFKVTPFISDLLPRSGVANTQVTITGTGFTEVTGVWIGDRPVAFYVVLAASRITATVNPGTTSGPVTVATTSGTYKTHTHFDVIVPLKGPDELAVIPLVQPNPAHDRVFISGLPNGQVLYLLDATGRVLIQAQATASGTAVLEVRQLAMGTYLLRIGALVQRIVVLPE